MVFVTLARQYINGKRHMSSVQSVVRGSDHDKYVLLALQLFNKYIIQQVLRMVEDDSVLVFVLLQYTGIRARSVKPLGSSTGARIRWMKINPEGQNPTGF